MADGQVFLQFGLDPGKSTEGDGPGGIGVANGLVGIDEVPRGRSELVCPYCREPLIARKGRQKSHHFAHDGTTCRNALLGSVIGIPLYDELATIPGLLPADLRLLTHTLRRPHLNRSQFRGSDRESFDRLLEAGMLEEVPKGERWVNNVGSHVYTAAGKQFAAAGRNRLSLAAFDRIQQDAMLRKLNYLRTLSPMGGSSLIDYQLYRLHLQKLLTQKLYFLRIEMTDGPTGHSVLNKIGVTHRTIEERLSEVRTELKQYAGKVSVDVVQVWEGKGRLELYFKRKYHRYQHRMGSMTEYFDFAGRGRRAANPLPGLAALQKVPLMKALGDL